MRRESQNIQIDHDCTLISFGATKSRARRQATPDVIFGPNRPSTRFRFSDMPASRAANVIINTGRTGDGSRKIHHIVMASETSQSSETKTESGSQASTSSFTVSQGGNLASRSFSNSVSSTKTENKNEASSGQTSNIVVVRKASPTNINVVRANVRRPSPGSNILRSRIQHGGQMGTNSGVGQMRAVPSIHAQSPPVVVLGTRGGNLANVAAVPREPTRDVKLTTQRAGNQGSVSSGGIGGVQSVASGEISGVGRGPPVDSDLFVVAANGRQRNINVPDGMRQGASSAGANLASPRLGSPSETVVMSRTEKQLLAKTNPNSLMASGQITATNLNNLISGGNNQRPPLADINIEISGRNGNQVNRAGLETPGPRVITAPQENTMSGIRVVRPKGNLSPSGSSNMLNSNIRNINGMSTEMNNQPVRVSSVPQTESRGISSQIEPRGPLINTAAFDAVDRRPLSGNTNVLSGADLNNVKATAAADLPSLQSNILTVSRSGTLVNVAADIPNDKPVSENSVLLGASTRTNLNNQQVNVDTALPSLSSDELTVSRRRSFVGEVPMDNSLSGSSNILGTSTGTNLNNQQLNVDTAASPTLSSNIMTVSSSGALVNAATQVPNDQLLSDNTNLLTAPTRTVVNGVQLNVEIDPSSLSSNELTMPTITDVNSPQLNVEIDPSSLSSNELTVPARTDMNNPQINVEIDPSSLSSNELTVPAKTDMNNPQINVEIDPSALSANQPTVLTRTDMNNPQINVEIDPPILSSNELTVPARTDMNNPQLNVEIDPSTISSNEPTVLTRTDMNNPQINVEIDSSTLISNEPTLLPGTDMNNRQLNVEIDPSTLGVASSTGSEVLNRLARAEINNLQVHEGAGLPTVNLPVSGQASLVNDMTIDASANLNDALLMDNIGEPSISSNRLSLAETGNIATNVVLDAIDETQLLDNPNLSAGSASLNNQEVNVVGTPDVSLIGPNMASATFDQTPSVYSNEQVVPSQDRGMTSASNVNLEAPLIESNQPMPVSETVLPASSVTTTSESSSNINSTNFNNSIITKQPARGDHLTNTSDQRNNELNITAGAENVTLNRNDPTTNLRSGNSTRTGVSSNESISNLTTAKVSETDVLAAVNSISANSLPNVTRTGSERGSTGIVNVATTVNKQPNTQRNNESTNITPRPTPLTSPPSQTTTDRYANIHFANLRPTNIMQLSDYKGFVDSNGGVPIQGSGKQADQQNINAIAARDNLNLESPISDNTNTIRKDPVGSNIIRGFQTANTKTSATASMFPPPKITLTYPVDSQSVAISMGKNPTNITETANTLDMQENVSIDTLNSNQLEEQMNDLGNIQRTTANGSPVILPKEERNRLDQNNLDLKNPIGINKDITENIFTKDSNNFAAEIPVVRNMPPVLAQNPKSARLPYPGYDLINMINKNRASKTSFDFFNVNKKDNAAIETSPSTNRKFTVGFDRTLNPLENNGEMLTRGSQVDSEVKTVWAGPGILTNNPFIADNVNPTTLDPETLRLRPPTLRPKYLDQTTNIAADFASNDITEPKVGGVLEMGNPVQTDNINVNPADITPDFIASINRDIHLINDQLMRSLQRNQSQQASMSGRNDAPMTNNGPAPTMQRNEPFASVKQGRNGIQADDDIGIATEAADILIFLTNNSTPVDATNFNFTDNIVNKTNNVINTNYMTTSVQNSNMWLNEKQFDDVSIKILKTLEEIVRELQLSRELAIKRHNALMAQEQSLKDQPLVSGSSSNSAHLLRAGGFDFGNVIPGIERKIGNVKTFATSIKMLKEVLPRRELPVDSNNPWDNQSSLSSLPSAQSQGNLVIETGTPNNLSDQSQATPSNVLQTNTAVNDLNADATNQILFDMINNLNAATDITKNNTQASPVNTPLTDSISAQTDPYQSLAEFSNTEPVVRSGIPINMDTDSYPLDSKSALNNDMVRSEFLTDGNAALFKSQLDGVTQQNGGGNINEGGTNNILNQEFVNWDTAGGAILNGTFSNNNVGPANNVGPNINEFNAPGINNIGKNEQILNLQNQLYDLSGLTEEQKSQVTRSISNIFPNSGLMGQMNPNFNRDSSDSSILNLNPSIYYCPTGDRFSCRAKGAYTKIPGMEWWCINHCRNGPCPRQKCDCTCDLTNGQSALPVGLIDNKDSIVQPPENIELGSASNGDDQNGKQRKKIFKKVITLTLNGSKENAVQVNGKGPEAMVSQAPQILSPSPTDQARGSPQRESFLMDRIDSLINTAATQNGQFNNNAFPSERFMLPDIRNGVKLDTGSAGGDLAGVKRRLNIVDSRLVCRGIGNFINIEGVAQWCTMMCRQGTCPEFVCSCLSQ